MDRSTIHIQRLCARHEHELVVHRLQIPEDGPWLVAVVTAQILLFQWASADDAIWKRAERDAANLTLVLAEIGCLACRYVPGFDAAVRVLQKGIDHAAMVAQGKASDPEWTVLTTAAPAPGEARS